MEHNLFCFIGESGSGKNTIERELEPSMKILVNSATREIRPGEVEGKDYYFITLEQFNKDEKNGKFVETLEVETEKTCGRKNKYGILKSELEKLKKGNALISLPIDRFLVFKEEVKKYKHIILVPIYIKTDKKIRYKKLIERLGEEKTDLQIAEIDRRMESDDKIFKHIENKVENLVVLKNDYDLISLVNIVTFVVNNSYIVLKKGAVCIKNL